MDRETYRQGSDDDEDDIIDRKWAANKSKQSHLGKKSDAVSEHY